jgi:hypothetical protein
LDILQSTHSVDAFVVTLNLLVDTDVEPRSAIPVIIRSAERLGVFGNELQKDQEDQEKPSALVIEVLGKLKERIHADRPVEGAAIGGAVMGAAIGYPTDKCPAKEDLTPPVSATGSSDYRTAVIGSLPPCPERPCLDCCNPPSEAEVLRALPSLGVEVPYVLEKSRCNVEIVTEKLVDKVGEERYYPLIGMAEMHHLRFKCSVYYTEKLEGNYPFTFTMMHPRVEVLYIDKDHLHLCPSPEKAKENPENDSWSHSFDGFQFQGGSPY